MTVLDLPAAMELSIEQQWPHRNEDWELFLKLGEGLVAERDGKLIGTTMAWCFGEDMATIGMVIVSPAAQGQGIGRKLMEEMIRRLGNRTIVLNATEEGLPLYQKLGFVETGRVYQHQGLVKDVPLAELSPGDRIRPKGKADTSLASFYGAASGMDRRALFDTLAQESRTVVYTHDNVPAGFAMLRRFGRGWSIAPVVAPDSTSAKALILHWLAVKQRRFCRIDVTAEGDLSGWLDSLGLPCVGSVRTMARGPAPVSGPEAKVFALAAQALG
ncbi:GNAT family N-acetyltransferase [Rhizorhapis sp. SPR117]|uniref:GNAT family N-acetyltransferase n=1 Tax=Rhizorhapis sp. SPR117 TaxID=2912611 RepID=UPI001F006682|nr:GNAT family N-acetyltransferase [Rhizorhapis sp. SPR117]